MECLQRRESQPVAWQTSTHGEMLVRSRAQTRRVETGAAWFFNRKQPVGFTAVESNRDGPRLERAYRRRTDLLRPATGYRSQAKLQVCRSHFPVSCLITWDRGSSCSRWGRGGSATESRHQRLVPKRARSRVAVEPEMRHQLADVASTPAPHAASRQYGASVFAKYRNV